MTVKYENKLLLDVGFHNSNIQMEYFKYSQDITFHLHQKLPSLVTVLEVVALKNNEALKNVGCGCTNLTTLNVVLGSNLGRSRYSLDIYKCYLLLYIAGLS